MASFFNLRRWFGRGGNTLAETTGTQDAPPMAALVPGTAVPHVDSAMQISTVWCCIERRANIVASLPIFVYNRQADGQKVLARGTRLYQLLHESPNARMTPFEFWRTMMMNHDLRGNAYARLERDAATGEVTAMWPMPADQVEHMVLADGSSVYEYSIGNGVAVLAEASVLHLKNLGNGTTGLAKLDYMAASVAEAAHAQREASSTFANGGKPSGLLMIDKLLTTEQRDRLRQNMRGISEGSTDGLHILEAGMKYEALSFTPEQQQLLETRKYGTEEMCRWFDVPPVLVHHANVTAWGSGIEQIIDGWHKLVVRALLVSIDQAIRKRVLTDRQRVTMHAEFSHDALLRGNIKDRYAVYTAAVNNGLKTHNECRQLENDPPLPGGDRLMVQAQMIPIVQIGQAAKPATTGAA